MDLLLDQLSDVNSLYKRKYVFELLVVTTIGIFAMRNVLGWEPTIVLPSVYLLLWFLLKRYERNTTDTNDVLLFRLNVLQDKLYDYVDENIKKDSSTKLLNTNIYKKNLERVKLGYLYTDTRLVDYLYELYELGLYDYNSDSFISMVLSVDGILRIRHELEVYYKTNGVYPENIASRIESSITLQKKALNLMHSFVYTLPKSLPVTKIISMATRKLHILLKNHTNVIRRMSVKYNIKNGINVATKFVETRETVPEPNDFVNNSFELY